MQSNYSTETMRGAAAVAARGGEPNREKKKKGTRGTADERAKNRLGESASIPLSAQPDGERREPSIFKRDL